MARCCHCGTTGASHTWDLQACADGRKKRVKRLCDQCDVKLNAIVLAFFNDPGATAKLDAYRARMQAQSTP